MLLAICCAANTLFWFFGIDLQMFSYIGGISFIPLIYLYISSYVFEFCEYHRIFLHYIVADNILSIIDYYFNIGFGPVPYIVIICISLFLVLYLHQKETKNAKSIKTASGKINR